MLITAFVAIGLIAPATVIATSGSPGTAAPARAATPAAHAGHVHGSTGAAAATAATATPTVTTARTLRWSDRATWGGRLPAAGAVVTIPRGRTVLLDVSPPALGGLTVNGTLVFAPKPLHLRSKWVMVHGRLQIGTPARPHPAKAVITLTESNPKADTMGMGPKVLGVMGRGVLDLHGRTKTSWVRLGATAPRGSRTLTLDRAVVWSPGDRLVLASTDFDGRQTEQVQVTRVVGRTVTLRRALQYTHWGALQRFGKRTLDERGEVGLLSRDIVIQGDAAGERAGFGGQVMAMKGATVRVRGVTLYRMGKRGELRRYPIHFHMMGSARGSYLRDSSIDHSFNRGITVHGTHNLLVSGNVIHDVIGHAVFLEDGIEQGNSFLNNLSVRTIRPKPEERLLPSDGDAPAAFWITNPNNRFRGNVAAASEGNGFWIALPEHPTGLSKTTKVWPRRTPLREFVGNRAHSNDRDGLHADNGPNPDGTTSTTFWEPRAVPSNPKSAKRTTTFDQFTAYKNRHRGAWIRVNDSTITRSTFADNSVGATYASGEAGVSDSLFVGESANKGTPAKWETKALDGRALPLPWEAAFPIRGFEFYDGPVFATKSHFEGFTPNKQRQASALSTLRFTAFPTSPRNWASGLSFGAGVNRVHAETRPAPKPKESENGYRTAVFFDRDGTVTGTARRYVVMNSPLLLTSRCTRVAAWNSSVCDDTFAATSFWTGAGDHPGSLTLTRDDGAAHTMMWGGDYEHTNLPANRRYTVSFGGHQPRQLSVVLAAINLSDGGGKGARWVRYAIPVGGGVRVEPDHGRPAPSRVASSAALDASTAWAAYYVEGGTLHLRLRATQPAEWLSVRVTR